MEEKRIKNYQPAKVTLMENELKKPNKMGPNIGNNLKESELQFHQSQCAARQEDAFNSSSNYHNGSSRMKINSMQDSFLNNCRHDRVVIEIDLIDRTKEKGIIVGFDVNTIIMENDHKYQFLIMKSAIVKIMPTNSVNYIFNDNYKCSSVQFDYSGIKNIGG